MCCIKKFLAAPLIALQVWGLTATSSFASEIKPRFQEVTRDHGFGETARYVGALYGLSWVGFLAFHRTAISNYGSWSRYRQNFGQVVAFDYDSPTFNWLVHVYTGSQVYLFYRARGYSKESSFALTALQSALFEFTIETLIEPASLEDLVNTPVLGGALGRGLELASLELLNSDSGALRTVGYLLNLPALVGLHEGQARLSIQPSLFGDKSHVAAVLEVNL